MALEKAVSVILLSLQTALKSLSSRLDKGQNASQYPGKQYPVSFTDVFLSMLMMSLSFINNNVYLVKINTVTVMQNFYKRSMLTVAYGLELVRQPCMFNLQQTS